MTPEQFLSMIERQPVAPAYLFLGPEGYYRDRCRRALIERLLPVEDREHGFVRLDLAESTLSAVVDDACSLSLFSPRRLIWVSCAEAALPRGRRGSASDSGEEGGAAGNESSLTQYLANPVPDVAVVFDSSRYEFDGEDKARQERVLKFYGAIRNVVEFPRFSEAQARRLAQDLARQLGLKIAAAEVQLIVEATGASATTIATEMEKLALYAQGRPITAGDIAQMVPQARATTIFALVSSLGNKRRDAALDVLDTLVKEGEYLPLALSFLATQFRQALAASEAGMRGSGQIRGYFSRLGVPMWPSRADQIAQTVTSFTPEKMRSALVSIAAADKDLRDTRPDDRIVMERFVLDLTS